jgi:hypothetical protein
MASGVLASLDLAQGVRAGDRALKWCCEPLRTMPWSRLLGRSTANLDRDPMATVVPAQPRSLDVAQAGYAFRCLESVRDALKRRVEQKVKDIAIEISGSTVNLRSRVNSSHERDAAPDVAWSSPGVRAVINDLRIG